jgi:hypothetical protein
MVSGELGMVENGKVRIELSAIDLALAGAESNDSE